MDEEIQTRTEAAEHKFESLLVRSKNTELIVLYSDFKELMSLNLENITNELKDALGGMIKEYCCSQFEASYIRKMAAYSKAKEVLLNHFST